MLLNNKMGNKVLTVESPLVCLAILGCCKERKESFDAPCHVFERHMLKMDHVILETSGRNLV